MPRPPTFLNCPAYLSGDSAARCGLPAEVEARYATESTDGPLESAKIGCPLGHWFNGPIESLTVPGQPAAASGITGLVAAPDHRQPQTRPPAELWRHR